MPRDPVYDVLFEPVRIGPVTARNRFYQVPHCNGMGRAWPSSDGGDAGVEGRGRLAVVCTEQCDIHPTSNVMKEIRLWDAQDIPYLARMTELIHLHGSLAGVELTHSGHRVGNLDSREIPLAPSATPVAGFLPVTARAMDKEDIRNLRRWHRTAALNARRAGFDLVYVYAGHDLSLPMHFLSRRHNRRSDEYGGSLENRCRLLRELIEETKEAVGDSCAVAVRLAVDELLGPDGVTSAARGGNVVAMLAELPDLWDVNVSAWENDSQTARFLRGGLPGGLYRLRQAADLEAGRRRSAATPRPTAWWSLVRKGVLDFIGAARPVDRRPVPARRRSRRAGLDDIRECIGCNICVSGDKIGAPMRWHPEPDDERGMAARLAPRAPAGARGRRERGSSSAPGRPGSRRRGAARTAGISRHCWPRRRASSAAASPASAACRASPPGAGWRDWRVGQLHKLANVEIYRESRLDAAAVLEAGCPLVAIATGYGLAPRRRRPLAPPPAARDSIAWRLATPDDIMAGALPEGPVVIFDDDHYYMGGVLAEEAGSRRPRGHPGDAGEPRLVLHPVHAGAGPHPAPPHRARLTILTGKTLVALHEGRGRARLRLHRPDRAYPGAQRRAGDDAVAGRRALPRARSAPGRPRRRRHPASSSASATASRRGRSRPPCTPATASGGSSMSWLETG